MLTLANQQLNPMASHGVVLDLPLLTTYHMRYSVPDFEISRSSHT